MNYWMNWLMLTGVMLLGVGIAVGVLLMFVKTFLDDDL